MSEWWTYRPSDFLMFSPATYWRLVERYNSDFWPLHVLMLDVGLLLLWLVFARPAERKAAMIVLAAAWLWVGWAFHWQRYAKVNWAAEYLAAAFALQAALLVAVALKGRVGHRPRTGSGARRIGLTLAVVVLFLYPVAGLLAGRPWHQAEAFGLMPEPTALVTAGLLLAMVDARRRWLLVIPVLSLVPGLATLWLLSG